MKTKIILIICSLAFVACAFLPIKSNILSLNAVTGSGFVNLYNKDCTDKTAYGQVLDVTYHYPQGMAYFDPYYDIQTVNGQTSYTSGFIDIRGYSYFTTNNDRTFEIICYNADKEEIKWIGENGTAQNFTNSGGGYIPPVMTASVSAVAYESTINNKTLVYVPQGDIAFVRVAFDNNEQNPYFNAFADDFEMLIKLNRDDTSGGVINALMVDIYDEVFTGFTLTALDLTFAVGTIIKNTSNEIIFSVPAYELYFYYTANGGWQSILTGVQYFSHYANETITLNCPTSIALYSSDLATIPEADNSLNGTVNNTETTITNIFGNSAMQIVLAIFGGLAVLMLLSALIGGRR